MGFRAQSELPASSLQRKCSAPEHEREQGKSLQRLRRLRSHRSARQKGQGLVEAALVLLIFLTLLIGIFDVAQVLFAHQALNERVRSAVRWGSVHEWQGPEAITNLVLYDQAGTPLRATEGFLGLHRENVEVVHRLPNELKPDDETLTITIVNFQLPTFTPGFGGILTSRRPVSFTAPMSRQPERPKTLTTTAVAGP